MSCTSVALTPSIAARRSARLGAHLGRHLALVAFTVTLVVAATGLILAHSRTPLAVPQAAALHAVVNDPALRPMLAAGHWDRVDVTPIDGHDEQLSFYRGDRIVATVTVDRTRHGLLLDATDLTREPYAYGSNIANERRVLGGLALLFVLMAAVWPVWRVRNLDCLVAAGTALSVVLFNDWTLTRMVLFSYPAMFYLALRCVCQALAAPGSRLPATPLYDHLTRRWSTGQRVRLLRILAAALAVITVLVGFTSLHVLDVGYAVMEGATGLVHGILPYGHIPDILHGDTYPIGSYLLYTPFAVLWPVHSAWDDASITLLIAIGSALGAAAAIWRLTRTGASSTGGLRTAIAVLAFPPLLVTVSTGTTDVVLAGMLAGALVLWHRPAWGAAVLSGAAWFKASPVLLVPLLLAPQRGRALARGLLAVLGVSLLMLAALVAVGGAGAPGEMLRAIGFQLTRSSPHTLWALVGSVPLQQLAEAATLALVAGAAVRLRRDPALAADRTRVAALAAAVLLGLQLAASYWTYMYLVWALPFLVVALFAAPPARLGSRTVKAPTPAGR